MKALVLWADDSSPNLGVRVLGRGSAAMVRRVWPDAEISFQNYGQRIPQLPSGRLRSLVKERVSGARGMQEWFRSFDLIIDTRSGDSFADIYGLRRLAVMSTVAEFASQSGVPVVLGPQTIGPFGTRRSRLLGRRSLARAAATMARDSDSAAYARALGHPVDVLTTDVVFALPRPQVDQTRDVVLNISGLLWAQNGHVNAERYRDVVVDLHRSLVAEGRSVTLMAHVIQSSDSDSDIAAIHEFVRRTRHDGEVTIPEDLDDVREVVASSSVVVGSRMHACLNALSVGTPAIPLAYSRKFEPLLRDIGWSHTVDLRTEEDPAKAVNKELSVSRLKSEAAEVVSQAERLLLPVEEVLASLPSRK